MLGLDNLAAIDHAARLILAKPRQAMSADIYYSTLIPQVRIIIESPRAPVAIVSAACIMLNRLIVLQPAGVQRLIIDPLLAQWRLLSPTDRYLALRSFNIAYLFSL